MASLAGLALAPCRAAADEPVMLDLEGAFLTPVTSPQVDRFQPGAAASAAVLFAPYPFLIPALRLRGGFLADGARPQDPRLRDPGVGDLFMLTAGVRLRPQGFLHPHDVTRGTNLWIEIDIGAALTGAIVRPAFEVGVGYVFDAGEVGVGPAAHFIHVLQTEEGLDPSSAYLLTLGLEVVLFDARPTPAEVAAIEAEEAAETAVDGDRDADGVLDSRDGCPDDAEDADGFEDEDGCPDLDDDRDGIPDASDRCPHEAEDLDGWQDGDGCPDPDNDGDSFLDASDACPNEPEVVNGNADDDGCPDEGLIELIGDRIVLEETVLFALNRARVRSGARPVLEAIVTLWRQHPDWVLVRIEGHADAQGEEQWNLELSQRRAERVVAALVELGMPAAMFTAEGFGSSHPRVEGTTEAAYQANRRVEFVVVERTADGRPAVHDGGTP
jgi:outer membrane protein OmpA-like peptidoglycan-associated protein